MSENATNTTVEQKNEAVMSKETLADSPIESTENGVSINAEPAHTYEQAANKEESTNKKTSIKDILLFAQNNIFTPKVCNIILLSLEIIIAALCVLQMVFWGLLIKDTYLNYWEAIKTFDFINIAVIAFMILFVLVLFVNIIKSVVSLIKKGYETHFETVSTMLAFYIFSLFVTKLFDSHTLLISDFAFLPILKILIILTIVYAFVRLFVKDFGSRICPLACSCGAIVLSIVMFLQDAGNFATYTTGSSASFDLADLNIYEYMQSAMGFGSNPEATATIESLLLEYGNAINFSGIGIDEAIVIMPLQFVPIMVANILPYAAISLIGYLIYGLVGRNYMQYYHLQSCKKVSISMLVVSVFSLAATIGLHYICKATAAQLTVQVNYTNAIVTILLCVVLIIVTSLPWKIYNIVYRHRYAAYKKSEGGN